MCFVPGSTRSTALKFSSPLFCFELTAIRLPPLKLQQNSSGLNHQHVLHCSMSSFQFSSSLSQECWITSSLNHFFHLASRKIYSFKFLFLLSFTNFCFFLTPVFTDSFGDFIQSYCITFDLYTDNFQICIFNPGYGTNIQVSISNGLLNIFTYIPHRQLKVSFPESNTNSLQSYFSQHVFSPYLGALFVSFCPSHHIQSARQVFCFYHGNISRVCPLLVFRCQD